MTAVPTLVMASADFGSGDGVMGGVEVGVVGVSRGDKSWEEK